MDGQELYNLYEAYMEVVENQQLGEGKIKLDQERRSRMGRKIAGKLNKASGAYSASKSGFMPKGIRKSLENDARKYVSQAQNISKAIKSAQKEEVDFYDIILSHLLDEGYAKTPEAAEAIMVNMSEEWRDSIIG
mgnify:FL=1